VRLFYISRMKLYPIHAGNFKLDGGAMFGVVPKLLWNKLNPADENNLCTWSTRCLLIEDGNRLILIDNGLGDKQDEKFFSRYYQHGEHSLEKSLKLAGFSFDDVTDMVLSHLHFDHCGGSIRYNDTKTGFRTTFKNANYWSNKEHWQWATQPNAREKASFLKENIIPIQESGQLKWIEGENTGSQTSNEYINTNQLGDNISIMLVRGHTDAMMVPHIQYKGKTVVYVADLLPSTWHVPLPYVCGYDTRPLISLSEKELFLNKAADEEFILVFEHDWANECCTLERTERGIKVKDTFTLQEYFGE
jgi:glyoxylase-like metal-dependent hydrolase (beta-lactamase superfamily II)